MIDPTLTLADLVLAHPESVQVFQRYRLDFCCQGTRSLAAACDEAGLDVDDVVRALSESSTVADGPSRGDPVRMSTPDLVEYIVAHHHGYLRKTLPILEGLATKVAEVHGGRNPALHELATLVRNLHLEVHPHLVREEQRLFPVLIAERVDGDALRLELAAMVDEHRAVGALLSDMRRAANEYHVPAWGCSTYRSLFKELEHLEGDVLRHIHLENHVLMPRFAHGSEQGRTTSR